MNIKELIEKYELELKDVQLKFGANYKTKVYEGVLDDLKQLDEPQKPVVPQFVADLIEYAKKSDWDLEDTFHDIAGNDGSSDIYQWYYSDSNNMDTFARAWLDGYEVEKEPKYTVKFKATKQYLSNDELGPHFDPSFRSNFTKSDLEKLGLAEVFNSPLFEVEEV